MKGLWQKWVLGRACGGLLAVYGLRCVVQRTAYVPGALVWMHGVVISGRGAVFTGIAYLGAAVFLFARFDLEKSVSSDSGQGLASALEVVGLLVVILAAASAWWCALLAWS